MISTEVENIRRGLEELHCSLRRFAEITGWSQPRLAEILRGARQPGRYELALFTRTVARMKALQADVRLHVGAPILICWTAAIRGILDARLAGSGDYSVGIRYPEPPVPTLPSPDGLTGADRVAETVGGLVNA